MAKYGYVGSGYNAYARLNPPKVVKPKPVPGSLPIPPEYGNLITSAPQYIEGENALTKTYDPNDPHLGTAAGSRAATIRALLVKYGTLPGTFKDQYGDINPETQAAAQANQHDVFDELLRNYQHNALATRNSLEARGILNSGAAATGAARRGNEYEGQVQQANTDLQGLINEALAGYTAAGNTYATGHQGLVRDVTNILQQDKTITGTTAHLVPGSQARYGQPVYSDAAGTLYTKDGKKYVPHTVAPPQPGYGRGAQL